MIIFIFRGCPTIQIVPNCPDFDNFEIILKMSKIIINSNLMIINKINNNEIFNLKLNWNYIFNLKFRNSNFFQKLPKINCWTATLGIKKL